MRQWHEGRQPLNRAGRALLRGYGHSATVRRPGARVHASHVEADPRFTASYLPATGITLGSHSAVLSTEVRR